MPTFSDFKWKYLFWTNLFQKSELQFKQKFGSYTNSNMKDSTVMFVFAGFFPKYPFWGKNCSGISKLLRLNYRI